MIKLIQGDCLQEMDKLIEAGIQVDLTVTSPPYDKLRTYENSLEWNEDIWKQIIQKLYVITSDGGAVVWVVGDATIKGSETGTSFKQALYFKEIGFNLHDTMIYHKNGTGACGSNYAYWQTFEYMFILTKGKIKTVNRLTNGKPRSKGGLKPGRFTKDGIQKYEVRSSSKGKEQIRHNIWTYNIGFASGDDKVKHPAKFPEQLAEDHILSWSNEGDTVLDPMMGSGTTGKMAIKNNRNFIGIEKVEKYFKIVQERLN
jgi:DNA modification methylase